MRNALGTKCYSARTETNFRNKTGINYVMLARARKVNHTGNDVTL